MEESGESCGHARVQTRRHHSTPGWAPGSFDKTGGGDLDKDGEGFLCWVSESKNIYLRTLLLGGLDSSTPFPSQMFIQ